MRRGRVEIVIGLGVLVLAASVAYNFLQSRQLAEAARQAAADRESFRRLRETLRQRDLLKPPTEGAPAPSADGTRASLARHDATTIQQLTSQLSEAQAGLIHLQAQLESSNAEHTKALADADERHTKEVAGLQSQLDNLKQQLSSVQDELQASRQRAAALEANNTKLGLASQVNSRNAADRDRTMADLQDLERRRENYLTSIMRRYRDITSQFQAMGGMLDSSHAPNPETFSSTALTRIQDAIGLADDDLHQLSELNAQVSQLQKKLAKK